MRGLREKAEERKEIGEPGKGASIWDLLPVGVVVGVGTIAVVAGAVMVALDVKERVSFASLLSITVGKRKGMEERVFVRRC